MRNNQPADCSKPYALVARTKQFALRTIRLVRALPKTPEARIMGGQLLRSATSVGANYRAARRARSRREFIAKMGIVEEEIDESLYWMELLSEIDLIDRHRLEPLMQEADELVAIVVTSLKTAKTSRK